MPTMDNVMFIKNPNLPSYNDDLYNGLFVLNTFDNNLYVGTSDGWKHISNVFVQLVDETYMDNGVEHTRIKIDNATSPIDIYKHIDYRGLGLLYDGRCFRYNYSDNGHPVYVCVDFHDDHNTINTLIGTPQYDGDSIVQYYYTLNKTNIFNIEDLTSINTKYDKSGGRIDGNVSVSGDMTVDKNMTASGNIKLGTTKSVNTISGTTTFNGKVVLPTGSNNGTVLDIPGNLGIGSQTNPNVTGRIQTYRKTLGGDVVCTKSSIGFNPITNDSTSKDYGMKYQVQYNGNIDKQDSACFYLSYSGCVLGKSGDPTKPITTFYTVLTDENAYTKDDTDVMINTLRNENTQLRSTLNAVIGALESLGVNMDDFITDDAPMGMARGIDPIDYIQNKERGVPYDSTNSEQ